MSAPNFPRVETTKYFCFGHVNEERQEWNYWDWSDYYDMMETFTLDRFKEEKQFRKSDGKGETGFHVCLIISNSVILKC